MLHLFVMNQKNIFKIFNNKTNALFPLSIYAYKAVARSASTRSHPTLSPCLSLTTEPPHPRARMHTLLLSLPSSPLTSPYPNSD